MGQALQELKLQVEHCPEIFDAIKQLTAQRFDVVVADWDEGPEATFFLQTARDLKLNRNTFVLALAPREVHATAQQAGA